MVNLDIDYSYIMVCIHLPHEKTIQKSSGFRFSPLGFLLLRWPCGAGGDALRTVQCHGGGRDTGGVVVGQLGSDGAGKAFDKTYSPGKLNMVHLKREHLKRP